MKDVSDVLKPPWTALSRQHEGATFGIWVFLASEVLFFGSLLYSTPSIVAPTRRHLSSLAARQISGTERSIPPF